MVVTVLGFGTVAAWTRNEDRRSLLFRRQRVFDRLGEVTGNKVEHALQVSLLQSEEDSVLGKIDFRRLILIKFDKTTKPRFSERKGRTGAAATRLQTAAADLLLGVLVPIVTGTAEHLVVLIKQFAATNAF